ncbi:MAG TPA: hypothetical protein VGI23_28580 [Steroidobacteraceae bacterium]
MSSNDKRKISSLRDLPRDIAPPRDLWKGIEAEITAPRQTPVKAPSHRLRYLAAAAVIAALGLGVWIGQWMYRPLYVANGTVMTANSQAQPGTGAAAGNTVDEPGAFHAAYVMGPKYINQRAQLVKDLETRLAQLPPESRAKVLSSLQAINDSKRDLERELGKDPSNALLQELLVNTYQDEMRVLTAVHEAGSSGEGI